MFAYEVVLLRFFRMSLILSSSSVSALSGRFGVVGWFCLGAGLIVTSNMAPAKFFSSFCSRICIVSFGTVRRKSVVVFARNSSS